MDVKEARSEEEFEENLPDLTLEKRRLLLLVCGVYAIMPLTMMLKTESAARAGEILLGIIALALVLTWIVYDSRELGYRLSTGMKCSLIIVTWIAVPIYFFKSHGFKYGSIALGKAIAFVLMMMAIAVGIGWLLALFGLISL